MHGASEDPQLRIPYVAAARVRWNGGEEAAIVCNLSAGGIHVELDREPPSEVGVRFPLPDGGPPVEARVAVQWTRHGLEEPAAPVMPLDALLRHASSVFRSAQRARSCGGA